MPPGKGYVPRPLSDWSFCKQSLEEVSRTFSRPIAMLRPPLERTVTCGYLLCRIVDTVEDDPEASLAERDELFARFLEVIERGAPAEVFSRRFAELLPGDDAERRLASNLDRVMSIFATIQPAAQAACRHWVAEMARGMAIYSHRKPGCGGLFALLTLADLERYCFFVAGTVGHMLTELFVLELPDLPRRRAIALESNAEEFGLGLQLVNILKDITDDRERDWSFIPHSVCRAQGLEVVDLIDPGARRRAHAALAPVFDRAERALDGAFEYCLAIPPEATDMRLFCMLPLWMAVRTLVHARGNDDQLTPGRPVKISREEVAHLIDDCVRRSGDDDAMRDGYSSLLAAHGPQEILPAVAS